MSLPFTEAQFLDTFRRYNDGVWPMQWVLVALGVLAVVRALRGGAHGGRDVALVLAVLWAWMAVVYHVGFFRAINRAAVVFAAAFLVQAFLLARAGLTRAGLTLDVRRDARGLLGAALVTFALVVYPLLGLAFGHRYPVSPTFGLPCPTTIFTIGLLVWTSPRAPLALWIVPLLWTGIGGSAAVLLGMHEDLALPVAGLVGLWTLVRRGQGAGAREQRGKRMPHAA
jgi:hypothetical protein